jgi:hypothetical protein
VTNLSRIHLIKSSFELCVVSARCEKTPFLLIILCRYLTFYRCRCELTQPLHCFPLPMQLASTRQKARLT